MKEYKPDQRKGYPTKVVGKVLLIYIVWLTHMNVLSF